MPRCDNPRCSREAKLWAEIPYNLWTNEIDDYPAVCVPCYLAIEAGATCSPNETFFSKLDGASISESERDALLGQ